MADFRATEVQRIDLKVGEARTLESLRQAVTPPYLLILPFIELPPFVQVLRQDNFDEEGVHGCVFTLVGKTPGDEALRVGFRDLRTGQVVIEKSIRVRVVAD
jgi:hypothetical protein